MPALPWRKDTPIKVAFAVYRHLAYGIFENILEFQKANPFFTIDVLLTTSTAEFETPETIGGVPVFVIDPKNIESIDDMLSTRGVTVVLFYGWSWIVREPILSKYLCMCLHPSALPRYRGGTPYQNQIMAGETESAVTVFKMDGGIDAGDIYQQLPVSFEGSLTEIFARVTTLGTIITKLLLKDIHDDKLFLTPQQDLDKYPPLKRRPPDYEISLSVFAEKPYITLYNFVRALGEPYPDPFIMLPEQKLCVLELQKSAIVPPDAILLNNRVPEKIDESIPLYVKVQDGYTLISKYRLEK